MKILLLTHRYPLPEKPDLISDVDALHHFAQSWARAGHEVRVIVLYQHQNNHDGKSKPFFYQCRKSEIARDNVRITLLETRFVGYLHALNALYHRRLAKKIQKTLDKPDLCLVHFPTRMHRFARNLDAGAPKCAVLHTTDILKLRGPKGKTYLRRLKDDYAAIGFRSDKLARDFHALTKPLHPEFPVLSGAPFVDLPEKTRLNDGILRLLYVGKLIERKRADALAATCARLPGDVNWRLTIAGEGPLRVKIEGEIKALGVADRVTLTGNVPRERVLELMQDSDVFVLQSYGETFGIVYLEAMAQRMLVIGSKDEGVDGTIIDGQNGFLLDARDDDALCALLTRLSRMPESERETIRAAAYETARNMTEENMANLYIENALAALKASEAIS